MFQLMKFVIAIWEMASVAPKLNAEMCLCGKSEWLALPL